MKNECQFKGSVLEIELNKPLRDPSFYYHMIRVAHEQKPESKFWEDAFNHIEKIYLKFQKRQERKKCTSTTTKS